MPKVFVVMRNHLPYAVFDKEHRATIYVAKKREISAAAYVKYSGESVYWMYSEFELNKEIDDD